MRRRGGSVTGRGWIRSPDRMAQIHDPISRARYRVSWSKRRKPRLERGFNEAAGLGFEPRLLGPEPSVLPLDDPATCRCGPGILARSGAIPGAALLDRLALLRRAARPAHDHALVLDELARIGVPVLVALDA